MQEISTYQSWFETYQIPYPNKLNSSNLMEYMELVWQWNSKINITAAKSKDELITRHILDSLTGQTFCSSGGNTILDIGSGGGFPAIPLAITLPLTHFILVERVPKKCAFLNRVKRKLNLNNITVNNCDLKDLVLTTKIKTSITRAVRVDNNVTTILKSLGFEKIITFTSENNLDSESLTYKLPNENKLRYLSLSLL